MHIDESTAVKPIGRLVYFKRLENDEKSAGGLLLPKHVMYDKTFWCQLIAKGPGQLRVKKRGKDVELFRVPATAAEPGDIVVIRAFEGNPINKINQDLLMAKGAVVEAIKVDEPWPPKGQRG